MGSRESAHVEGIGILVGKFDISRDHIFFALGLPLVKHQARVEEVLF